MFAKNKYVHICTYQTNNLYIIYALQSQKDSLHLLNNVHQQTVKNNILITQTKARRKLTMWCYFRF